MSSALLIAWTSVGLTMIKDFLFWSEILTTVKYKKPTLLTSKLSPTIQNGFVARIFSPCYNSLTTRGQTCVSASGTTSPCWSLKRLWIWRHIPQPASPSPEVTPAITAGWPPWLAGASWRTGSACRTPSRPQRGLLCRTRSPCPSSPPASGPARGHSASCQSPAVSSAQARWRLGVAKVVAM